MKLRKITLNNIFYKSIKIINLIFPKSLKKSFIKITIISFSCLLFSVFCTAQYRPNQTSLNYVPSAINPSIYGFKEKLEVTVGVRGQWNGLEGSPKIQYLNASIPIERIGGGIGFKVENLETGATRDLSFSLGYSYFIAVSEFSRVSLGLRGGMRQVSINGDKLITPQGNYLGEIDHKDNILFNSSINGWSPTFDIGVGFESEPLLLGIGVINILNLPSVLQNDTEELSIYKDNTYYFHASYDFSLPFELIATPFLKVQSNLIEQQVTTLLSVTYQDRWSIIGGYRGYSSTSSDAVNMGIVWKMSPKWMFGYIFDNNIGGLKNVSSESHELFLKYSINRGSKSGKLPPIIYNPRFF